MTDSTAKPDTDKKTDNTPVIRAFSTIITRAKCVLYCGFKQNIEHTKPFPNLEKPWPLCTHHLEQVSEAEFDTPTSG